MLEQMKDKLREYDLDELRSMLNTNEFPDFVQEPRIFLAALVEVIREKQNLAPDFNLR